LQNQWFCLSGTAFQARGCRPVLHLAHNGLEFVLVSRSFFSKNFSFTRRTISSISSSLAYIFNFFAPFLIGSPLSLPSTMETGACPQVLPLAGGQLPRTPLLMQCTLGREANSLLQLASIFHRRG
jgi:hypothetical protein